MAIRLPPLQPWIACGAWADRAWHQSWLGIAGIVFGGISGLVYVVRLVMSTGTDNGKGSAGSQ